MKKIVLTPFFLIGAAIIYLGLSSSSAGRANSANAGNTGAPGDATQTCVSCHGGSAFSVTQTISVTDTGGSPIQEYTPGEMYEITVTNASSGSPSGYGFQLLALDNGNGNIGGWSNPASNVQLATANGGREYAEHNGVSSTNSFTLNWTAPAAGTGDVTLYASGNAVNGDGTTAGDGADVAQLSLSEAGNPSTSVFTINNPATVIYPNPVTDQLNINNYAGNIQFLDLTAKVVFSRSINQLNTISIGHLPNGIYFLQLESGAIYKVVKH